MLLLLCGCQSHNNKPKPSDTKYKENKRDWEYLYAVELKNALIHQDDAAFYFFWPLYLEARYENKLKRYKH